MDVETNEANVSDLPPRPTTRPPPSVFFAHMDQILTDPARRAQPGYLAIDDASLQLILRLMAEEVAGAQQLQEMFSSLSTELAATRNELKESRSSMETQFKNARANTEVVSGTVAALENVSSPSTKTPLSQSIHAPGTQAPGARKSASSYAARVAATVPVAPQKAPPPKHLLDAFKPGKVIIHVASEASALEKIDKKILIGKANDALKALDAVVQDKPVTIKALEVLKSGDVCFYAKNRAHQSWLAEHKHLWSKKVHVDLTSTPATTSVFVHNLHVNVDISDPLVISRIGIANGFVDADFLRARWIKDHGLVSRERKTAIWSFVNKEIVDRLVITGIYHENSHYKVTRIKKLPAQCFQCLKMGHFGKFCKEKPRCARCGKEHSTRDFPEGSGPIVSCVLCEAERKNGDTSIPSVDHDPFKLVCHVKQRWFKKKPHAVR
ncbi:hypothetical protein PSHT_02188 [Puccinia striiformis]|uniref:CCHC-type domain-containing protein n=1 Tax=Puccinia striiformis TaxID=27350 RepID=A0A2S4WIL7_9BASI|nr:hypothetical protein PSHT_02188 [Puccinia striiformis]